MDWIFASAIAIGIIFILILMNILYYTEIRIEMKLYGWDAETAIDIAELSKVFDNCFTIPAKKILIWKARR